MQIANLVIEMSANIARLSADMQAARGVVERNAQAMQKAADLAGKALGALGVGLSAAVFTGFIKKAIDAADAVGKLSNSTGIATRDLAGLQIAYEQAGLGGDTLATSIGKLSKHMADGSKELEAMGVKARNADGSLRNTKDVLYDVANKFAGYADGAGKAALAQELFGKSGAEMIPLLNGGAKAMQDMQVMAEKLGLTIEAGTSAKAAEFNDTLDLLQRAVGAVGTRLAAELLPTLTDFINATFDATVRTNDLNKAASDLAKDSSIVDWADAGAMGLARLIDVLKVLPALFAALKGSVSAVLADVALVGQSALMLNPVRISKSITNGENPFADITVLLEKRNKTLADSNAAYANLWNMEKNTMETAMAARIALRKKEAASSPTAGGEPGGEAPNIAAIKAQAEARKAAASEAAKAAQEALKQYESIMQSVRERIKLSDQELAAGQPLTAAQKAETKVLETLDSVKGKVNATQRLAIELAMAEAKAKEFLVEQQHANITAAKELAAEETKRVAALEDTLAGMAEQNKRMSEEIELIGLSATAQRAILAARRSSVIAIKEEQLARMQNATTMTREQIALEEEIRLLKERNGLFGDEAAAQDRAVAFEKSVSDFKDLWSSVDRTAHDTFVNIFEGGQDAFTKLRNVLKSTLLDLLYQMTVKKWVFNIAATVTSTGASIANAAGVGGSGGGMGMLSGLGSLTSGSGILGAGGLGLQSGFGALINGGLSGIGAAVSGGLSAIGAGTGASIAAGLGTIAGALGPIGLGIAGAMMLMPKGDKRFGSSYQYDAANDSRINGKDFIDGGQRYGVGGQFSSFDRAGGRIIGGPNSGTDFDGKSVAQATVIDSINALYKRLGSQTSLAAFQSGFESSEKGKGFAYAGGVTNKGDVFGQGANGGGHLNRRGSMTNEQAVEAYALELKQATLQALQSATDIPKSIASMLDGADIEALSTQALDQLSAAIDKQITDVAGLREALAALPLGNLKDLSFDAASGLIAAAGGLEQLQTNLSFYHQNFYSEAERAAASIVMLSDEFAKLGLSVPENTAQYRDLIAAQDSSTVAGQGLISALLGLGPAFASAAASAAAAASAMSSAIQNYGSSADLRNFQVEQIRQGLANGGLNLTNAQIAGASRDDALAAYNHYVSAGDTRSADAIFSMQQQFANITQANGASGKPRVGWNPDGSHYAGGDGGGASISEINEATGASAAASAAAAIGNAWQSITDSIWGEVKRIRGLLEGSGQDAFAAAQARFAIATAQARVGDQDAAKALPQLSQAMLMLAEDNAGTLIELRRIRAQTAASLTATGTGLSSQYGLSIPQFAVGTNYVPRDMLAMIHEGEAIVPRAYNPAASGSGGNDGAVVAELRTQNALLLKLLAANETTRDNTGKAKDVLVRVTHDGQAMQSEPA